MKFRTRHLQNEDGFITFPILMICTSMLICVATMLTVALIRMQIETNLAMHQTAFDAAKSVAVVTARGFTGGEMANAKSTAVGDVTVTTTVSGTDPVTVLVEGTYKSAVGTVLFKYDTIQKKITDWEENVPLQ